MSYKMDHEVQTVMKLKLAEKSLATMLQKIDKEINQTEVEWMHLKSLIKPKSSVETKTEVNQLKENVLPQKGFKVCFYIDTNVVNIQIF